MPKISLNKQFVQDSIGVIKQRGLRGLLFGHQAQLSSAEKELIESAPDVYRQTKVNGSKSGTFSKVDAVHKGSGRVYVLAKQKGKVSVVFSPDTKVTNGPDLWVYLSDSRNPKQSLGSYKNLGLIMGTKGGQVYELPASGTDIKTYHSVIIYCKQFEVLFSYAILN